MPVYKKRSLMLKYENYFSKKKACNYSRIGGDLLEVGGQLQRQESHEDPSSELDNYYLDYCHDTILKIPLRLSYCKKLLIDRISKKRKQIDHLLKVLCIL